VSSIHLRRASPDDAAAYARLMADEEVFSQLLQLPFPDASAWRKRLETPREAGQADIDLVAELDGEVVGQAALFSMGAAVRRRHAMGLGIGVAKPAQRRGVGNALIGALTDYADRWAGVLRIELTVWVDNEPAQQLYRKFGFEVEGRLLAWGLRGGRYVDAIAMARLHPASPALAARGGSPAAPVDRGSGDSRFPVTPDARA